MIRRLRPDPATGIIVPKKEVLFTGAPIRQLKQPSPALRRIDKLRNGDQFRILVSRSAGGLGDVLMTLPTVKQIRKQYNCLLDYSTDFEYLGGALVKVLQGNPYIDNIIDYRTLTDDIKEQTYDAVIDLTCPCTVHEQPGAEPINRVDLFARHAGVRLEDMSLDYYMTPEELAWGQEFINSRNIARNKLILVAPHSSTNYRDLPYLTLQRSIMEILKQVPNTKMIITTHSTDSSKQNWKLYGTEEMRDYDVRHIAAVMHYCDLVMCQDSAILHLANALNKKTLTFFGPTDPRARINYFPNAVALCPAMTLRCWPSWYSYGACNNTQPCWKMFTEKMIVDTAVAMLNNTELPNIPELLYYGDQAKQKGSLYEVL